MSWRSAAPFPRRGPGGGLRSHRGPEERELVLARAKICELMVRLELAEDLIE